MQRPEYITGVSENVMIGEVLQTSESSSTPQGNMSGHAVTAISGKFGKFFCPEHGFIIGILSVMPTPSYFQGLHRSFSRLKNPLDYAFPEFARLGEQAVFVRELYGYSPEGSKTFGYVPQYSEYKYMNNRVAGDFRTSLSFWHDSIKFGSVPRLNRKFIECPPESVHHPIFAVADTDTDYLYVQVANKIKASRLLPFYGTPSL